MYASKALLGHHWVLVQDSTGAALMGAKLLPCQELFEHNLTLMPPVPLMMMVGELHPHEAEQLLWAVLRDIGLCFCDPAQMIIIPHPFSFSAVYDQMTALLQELEQMALTWDIYLTLLTQMFMMQSVSMEQYLQLWTHIHGSELPTKSEATATIFSQFTTGEASNEEAMSCDDEVSVMPPPALKLLSSGQTLQGSILCWRSCSVKFPLSAVGLLFPCLIPGPTPQRVKRVGAALGASGRFTPLRSQTLSLLRSNCTAPPVMMPSLL